MQPDTPASGPLTPAIVFGMLQAHHQTAALRAAIELDLFRAIGQGHRDVPALAQYAKASERGIRILCDYLVINGLLVKEDGRYRHTPTSAAFLDPASPACLSSVAHFLSRPELLEPYEHLAEVVRNGRTSLPGEGTVEAENPVWVEFAQSMAPMMAPAGRAARGDCAAGPHRSHAGALTSLPGTVCSESRLPSKTRRPT